MTKDNSNFVLASSRSWNISTFQKARRRFPGRWAIVSDPTDLEPVISSMSPRYVFFPHWSHIVPESILNRTECVCFHMTDVPYGRGGSPLQNLISRGHLETAISALRMVPVMDAGPVYMKSSLSLDGSAREIFMRAAEQIMDMIKIIIDEEPAPIPQEGTPTLFARRKPEESEIWPESHLEQIYDHIRMLDADGYPHAYIDHGDWRVHFTDAQYNDKNLVARAYFSKRGR